ncbi:MAG: DnaJ domain-containing protein [Candidatus Omnitrophota bacterium]
MTDYKKIEEARRLLGLGEDASLDEIKDAYRALSFKYHPDRCKNPDKKDCEEKFKRINHAKDLIMHYCANYRFSFKESDVKKNSMDRETYEHLKRFYDGWFGELDL